MLLYSCPIVLYSTSSGDGHQHLSARGLEEFLEKWLNSECQILTANMSNLQLASPLGAQVAFDERWKKMDASVKYSTLPLTWGNLWRLHSQISICARGYFWNKQVRLNTDVILPHASLSYPRRNIFCNPYKFPPNCISEDSHRLNTLKHYDQSPILNTRLQIARYRLLFRRWQKTPEAKNTMYLSN